MHIQIHIITYCISQNRLKGHFTSDPVGFHEANPLNIPPHTARINAMMKQSRCTKDSMALAQRTFSEQCRRLQIMAVAGEMTC